MESYYYYQKAIFIEEERKYPEIQRFIKITIRYILILTIGTTYLFTNLNFLIIGFTIMFCMFVFDLIFTKKLNVGSIIFFKDKMAFISDKFNAEFNIAELEEFVFIINEYKDQRLSFKSFSSGFNNFIHFNFAGNDYDFEVIITVKNIEFIYNQNDKWYELTKEDYEMKIYTKWRFLTGVRYS